MSDYDLLSLPFDQYQRYRCLADVLALLPMNESPLILDVGGYSRLPPDKDFPLLPPFVPDGRLVVLDQPFCEMPGYVQGDGLSLPFADRAFPCVVSVDTLEHIPPDARALFVDEMMRVAGQHLVLAAPFASELTSAAERIVFDYSAAVLGVGHPQIGEHLELGLPDLAQWRGYLEARGWSVVEIANGYLPRWLPMMLTRHYVLSLPGGTELCPQIDRLYNHTFYPADQRSPSYRCILVASRSPGGLGGVLKYAASASAKAPRDPFQSVLLTSVWRDVARRARQREDEMAELREHARRLEEATMRLQARVAAFEGGRFIRFMAWLDRQKRRLRNQVRGA